MELVENIQAFIQMKIQPPMKILQERWKQAFQVYQHDPQYTLILWF